MSEIRGLSEREVEELYRVYDKSFGDCEAPKEIIPIVDASLTLKFVTGQNCIRSLI